MTCKHVSGLDRSIDGILAPLWGLRGDASQVKQSFETVLMGELCYMSFLDQRDGSCTPM